jgi:hypothetical protein
MGLIESQKRFTVNVQKETKTQDARILLKFRLI